MVILQTHLKTSVFFFPSCGAGECLWLHDLRLPELLRPLLWQKLPPCGLLCQPWPAHGDEPVAAAAPVWPTSTVPAPERTVTMLHCVPTSKVDSLAGCEQSQPQCLLTSLDSVKPKATSLQRQLWRRHEDCNGDFDCNLTMFNSVMLQQV